MNKLEQARKGIESVDRQLAALFEERMQLCAQVLEYKRAHGLPILDAAQEEKVLARNLESVQDQVVRDYYVLFLKDLMKVSRAYQARLMHGMKIAYSGVPGAFAQIAVDSVFPDAQASSYPDFESAYRACESGEADAAVLPVENSFAGDVGAVMDLTFSGSLYISLMLDMDVSQNLLTLPEAKLSDIKTVVSHPQALAQCAAFITGHAFQTVEMANTAMAAKYVADHADKSIAAIASSDTATLYGLEILAPNINSSAVNTTRFAVFTRSQAQPSADSGDEHAILVFTVRNEAGALAKILNIIGSHGYNMSSLHSRPVAGPLWSHYFFAELEGGVNTENGRDLLRQLSSVCDRLRLAGTYRSIAI